MPPVRVPGVAATQGEILRRVAYAATATVSALLAFAVASRMGHMEDSLQGLSPYNLWVTMSGLAGGALALRITEDHFGHPGPAGALRAVRGGMVNYFAASIIAGTLALPLYGTMFGPMLFGSTIAGRPVLGLVWIATLLMAHLCLSPWRRERDSLFVTPPSSSLRRGTGLNSRRGSSGWP